MAIEVANANWERTEHPVHVAKKPRRHSHFVECGRRPAVSARHVRVFISMIERQLPTLRRFMQHRIVLYGIMYDVVPGVGGMCEMRRLALYLLHERRTGSLHGA